MPIISQFYGKNDKNNIKKTTKKATEISTSIDDTTWRRIKSIMECIPKWWRNNKNKRIGVIKWDQKR